MYDLVLFLYIQSYKRLLPKAHKDSAAVADVWPSTSVFDGYFSALSPIQLLGLSSTCPSRVDALALAEALQISPDLASRSHSPFKTVALGFLVEALSVTMEGFEMEGEMPYLSEDEAAGEDLAAEEDLIAGEDLATGGEAPASPLTTATSSTSGPASLRRHRPP